LIALANATASAASANLVDSAFFWAELFALTLSAILAILLTFIVQSYLSRPKVKGGVFGIVQGEWKSHDYTMETRKSFFWPYVYLTNQHRNAVWPLDYEFEVDFGKGYVKLERQYGDISGVFPETISATISAKGDSGSKPLKMQNLSKQLLYVKSKPIQYGDFLHGFVMFTGDRELQTQTIVRVKFTCIDAFGRRHTFEANQEKLLSLALFSELLQASQ
jgi:hypothetical protein